MAEGRSPIPTAIFVDDTGAKGRKAAIAAKLLGLAAFSFVLLILATLARAPWVPDLSLPGLGTPAPNVAQAPPDLGPTAAVTPIPEEAASDSSDSGSTPADETTSTTATTTTSTQVSPPSTGPSVTAPGSTTTTTDRPGNGPPTSIPGNGNGPPTSLPRN